MKKLQNILCLLLCAVAIFGCRNQITRTKEINTPPVGQYIPQEESKQTIKPNEEQKTPEESVGQVVVGNNPIKIALLVPLTGVYKDLGQGLLNAAQLAIFRIGDANLTLLPIDTSDSPYAATQAAKKAVAEGAKIILGPVFSSGTKAVAKIAVENNIQVVSFSNDKSLSENGVFAIGLMPEQQVRRVSEFAVKNNIKDFVALTSNDAYGKIVTEELKKINGISLIKNQIYQVDAQGRALQIDAHVKAAYEALVADSSSKQKALLMPASPIITGQILNALSKYNIDKSKIQIIGSDQWYEPSLLSNQALGGAWFAALPRERRNEFESKFKEVYGYNAPKLSGLAYDGIALAATVVKLSNGEGFTKEALTTSRGFMGVDGIFRLQENGLAERGFAVMSVRDGHVIVVDPAPTSFSDIK